MNQVILRGRFTADPDLKLTQTKKGEAIPTCRFTLAVNEYKREAQFIDCTAFGKLAETIISYMEKGREALIIGRLNMKSIRQDDGSWRKYSEVICTSLEFIGKKPGEDVIIHGEAEEEISE